MRTSYTSIKLFSATNANYWCQSIEDWKLASLFAGPWSRELDTLIDQHKCWPYNYTKIWRSDIREEKRWRSRSEWNNCRFSLKLPELITQWNSRSNITQNLSCWYSRDTTAGTAVDVNIRSQLNFLIIHRLGAICWEKIYPEQSSTFWTDGHLFRKLWSKWAVLNWALIFTK